MSQAHAKLRSRISKANSLLCVGLDPEFEKLPSAFKSVQFCQFDFNKFIIDQTAEYVSAFKLNAAAYEARGAHGWLEMEMTVDYIKKTYPDIFTICDAKRADIGYSTELYARAILDNFGFDAITANPYLGSDGIEPFLDRKEKAVIILCRTSNPGAGEIQDLESQGKKLWQIVAEKAAKEWNKNGNLMLVAGATYPEELASIRSIVGDMTLLVPGVGNQGGSVEAVMRAGMTPDKSGLIVNSSKGIIFSQNPHEAAKKLRDDINTYRV